MIIRSDTTNVANYDTVLLVVDECCGVKEVPDTVALGIAVQWQSPGSIGLYLAELASTGSVDHNALLDDIHNTRRHGNPSWADSRALDMLATWAIAKTKVSKS